MRDYIMENICTMLDEMEEKELSVMYAEDDMETLVLVFDGAFDNPDYEDEYIIDVYVEGDKDTIVSIGMQDDVYEIMTDVFNDLDEYCNEHGMIINL